QRRPRVTCRVVVDFDRERFEFFAQPRARHCPRWRERDALRAVFVGGEAAEFLEFSDGALWVQQSSHGFQFNNFQISLPPNFSWVLGQLAICRTVSTVSSNRGQTVETVLFRHDIAVTRLKPGVNENG